MRFRVALAAALVAGSVLPEITESVAIDGTGNQIRIDGASVGAFDNGLQFGGGTSTVRGLSVTRFGNAGIDVRTGATATIQGLLPHRRRLQPNGVVLQGPGHVVGAPGPGQGNQIAGNTSAGVDQGHRTRWQGRGAAGSGLQVGQRHGQGRQVQDDQAEDPVVAAHEDREGAEEALSHRAAAQHSRRERDDGRLAAVQAAACRQAVGRFQGTS